MEEKIREAVEQSLHQLEQEQEIQMLTEQVEVLQKENDRLTTFNFVLIILLLITHIFIRLFRLADDKK